jgi:hypothetical protein
MQTTRERLAQALPLMLLNEGWWAGTYTHLKPDWSVEEEFTYRIRCEFPEDGPVAYRQHSFYAWADGRTQSLVFEAGLSGDRLTWDNGLIAGELWQIDGFTLYLTFRFAAQPGVEVCEMIQTAADGETRARTWHWFKDRRLIRLTLVNERRVEPFAT